MSNPAASTSANTAADTAVNRAAPIIFAIQNGRSGPINLLGKWLTEFGFDVRTLHAYAQQPLPISLSELIDPDKGEVVAGLITLGGSVSVNDEENNPWLINEKALIRQTVSENIPTLGICLGAQLLASSLGGAVEQGATPEIGIFPITISAQPEKNLATAPQLFAGLEGAQLPTMQWHEDFITRLPADSISLASSDLAPHQIFCTAGIHYGFQFHPEADSTIVSIWERKADQAYQRSDKPRNIGATVEENMAALQSTWKPVIKRWGDLVMQQLSLRLEQP